MKKIIFAILLCASLTFSCPAVFSTVACDELNAMSSKDYVTFNFVMKSGKTVNDSVLAVWKKELFTNFDLRNPANTKIRLSYTSTKTAYWYMASVTKKTALDVASCFTHLSSINQESTITGIFRPEPIQKSFHVDFYDALGRPYNNSDLIYLDQKSK